MTNLELTTKQEAAREWLNTALTARGPLTVPAQSTAERNDMTDDLARLPLSVMRADYAEWDQHARHRFWFLVLNLFSYDSAMNVLREVALADARTKLMQEAEAFVAEEMDRVYKLEQDAIDKIDKAAAARQQAEKKAERAEFNWERETRQKEFALERADRAETELREVRQERDELRALVDDLAAGLSALRRLEGRA